MNRRTSNATASTAGIRRTRAPTSRSRRRVAATPTTTAASSNRKVPYQEAKEGALQYIESVASVQQPFFLIISLVNPHDVLFYPSNTFEESGYDSSWLAGDIEVPSTNEEDLSTKPSVQEEFLKIFNLTGKPKKTRKTRLHELLRQPDAQLRQLPGRSAEQAGSERSLRRHADLPHSDHGEMGLSHGGLRQKNFNVYEESLKVPLVYSNPKMYPRPQTSDALVSHVDLLPTLASLAGAPQSARRNWQGVDYSDVVLNPAKGKEPQDYVAFTYDDFQSGQAHGPYPKQPNHVRSIREKRWKLAKYVRHQDRNPRKASRSKRPVPETAPVGDVRPQNPTRTRKSTSPSKATNGPRPRCRVHPPEKEAGNGSKRPA